MTSQRPYLLRAIYEWIEDCGETPYLLVDASVEGVVVPEEHIEDNQIVLNIGAGAVRNLNLGNEFVMFDSRFNGVAMEIALPVGSIKAIYCKDSGEGMAFPEEVREDTSREDTSREDTRAAHKDAGSDETPSAAPVTEAPTTQSLTPEREDATDPPAPPNGGKPTLKLV